MNTDQATRNEGSIHVVPTTPGHVNLLKAAGELIIIPAEYREHMLPRITELMKPFVVQLEARKNDLIPEEAKEELFGAIAAASVVMGIVWPSGSVNFLLAQEGFEALRLRLEATPGWSLHPCPCGKADDYIVVRDSEWGFVQSYFADSPPSSLLADILGDIF